MSELKEFYKLFPDLWEGYEVGEPLGSGSFGDVYELKKADSKESVTEAMKEILVPPLSAGGIEEAFFQGLDASGAKYYYEGMKKKALDEVEILKRFSDCPNIVRILDYTVRELPEDAEEFGWVVFVRMELLMPFKTKLLQDKITLPEIIKLVEDLCIALEACHREEILHRDIKPENIFYSPVSKSFKLGDFGIACYMSRLTEEKGLPGTLTHMAPEVYRGEKFDYAADLYAVGMILYKLLNENRVPFLPDYPEIYSPVMRNQAIQRRLRGEEVLLPSIVRKYKENLVIDTSGVSGQAVTELAKIAAKAIAANRDDRYHSPEELKQVLLILKEKYNL